MRKALALRAASVLGVLFLLAMPIYLFYLYRQLDTAFSKVDEFTPTRIYSDVTRLAAGMSKAYVMERLKSLSYPTTVSKNQEEETLQFTLHDLDYPDFLVPETDQSALELRGQPIQLKFDLGGKNARLLKMVHNEEERSAIYLEPELVTTMSRNAQEDNKIRDVIPFEDIPSHIWQAIIAVEDQHFMDHRGLDPRGLARAIWVNLKTLSFAQGGSTLTQQLVKNLLVRRKKNLFKKLNEIFLALILELKYDKEEILARYLNEVYLGQIGNFEIHGVVEGSKYFFGKQPSELNLGEIALMAGLIRGPAYYSPYRYLERAKERQSWVLKKMVETGQITDEEAQIASKQPIRLVPPVTGTNRAPYFTDYVKAELIRQLKGRYNEDEVGVAGFKVYTTLNLTLNDIAQKSISLGIDRLNKLYQLDPEKNPELRLEGALASVDPATGYIRALIGGQSYQRSTFNRILNMKRQIGSTFKPIVTMAAFQKGKDSLGTPYTAGYPVLDAPWKLVYDHQKQSWEPKNYDPDFRGWISLNEAQAHSINTAISRLGIEAGLEQVISTAKNLGITEDLPAVPSLTLGIVELSPIDLLKVYALIANRGIQDELTVLRGITQNDGSPFARFVYTPTQKFDPALAELMSRMLQSTFIEGTARMAKNWGFTEIASGKTGTTSNHRDSWFAGFTDNLVTTVWVGLDQGQQTEEKPKVKLTGAGAALPIWIDYMKAASKQFSPKTQESPSNLTTITLDRKTGLRTGPDCPPSHTLDVFVTQQQYEWLNTSKSSCEEEFRSEPSLVELP